MSLRYWPGALAVVGSNPTGPIVILVLKLNSLEIKSKIYATKCEKFN